MNLSLGSQLTNSMCTVATTRKEINLCGFQRNLVPSRSKKAGRFEKLLGFARSHSIVTRGSVSRAPPHNTLTFLNLNGTFSCQIKTMDATKKICTSFS